MRIPKSKPFAFGLVFSCAKTSFSDLLVQKVIEGREEIDWKRNSVFAAFGFAYLGGFQYLLYVKAFGRIFPNAAKFASAPVAQKLRDIPGLKSLGWQVGLDQFVHHPLLYFPVFYAAKEYMTAKPGDDAIVATALGKYKTNMAEDLTALWKIWVPSTIINFAFMPMWARIPWVATTSLLWTCVLSVMRGASDEDELLLEGIVPIPGAEEDGAKREILAGHVSAQTMGALKRSLRSLRGAPPLDPAKEYLMVTVVSEDRVGLLASFATSIMSAGGNVTTSKMVRFGDTFVAVVLVECVDVSVADLEVALRSVRSEWTSKTPDGSSPTIVLRRVGSASKARRVEDGARAMVGLPALAGGLDGGALGLTAIRANGGGAARFGEGGAISSERRNIDIAVEGQPPAGLSIKLVVPDQPGIVVKVGEIFAAHELNVDNMQTEQYDGDDGETMFVLEAELHPMVGRLDKVALERDVRALSERIGTGCVIRVVDLPAK